MRVNDAEIVIASDAADVLSDMQDFFAPYHEFLPDHDQSVPLHRFNVIESDAIHDKLSGKTQGEPIRTLRAMKTHHVEIPLDLYRFDDDRVMMTDPWLHLFYIGSRNGGVTTIVGRAPNNSWKGHRGSKTEAAIGLLRLILSTWMWDTIGKGGGSLVHACVMEKDGRAILIAGDKHAGKTTSFLNLASAGHFNIVTNDQALVQVDDASKQLTAAGVPTFIPMRWPTLQPFERLHKFRDRSFCIVQDLAECLDVEIRLQADVVALAFISYNKDLQSPRLTEITAADAARRLDLHQLPLTIDEHLELLGLAPADHSSISYPGLDDLRGLRSVEFETNENVLPQAARMMEQLLVESEDAHANTN